VGNSVRQIGGRTSWSGEKGGPAGAVGRTAQQPVPLLSRCAAPWHKGCAVHPGCLPSFQALSRLRNLSPAPTGLFFALTSDGECRIQCFAKWTPRWAGAVVNCPVDFDAVSERYGLPEWSAVADLHGAAYVEYTFGDSWPEWLFEGFGPDEEHRKKDSNPTTCVVQIFK
jgi:hypothetical protein